MALEVCAQPIILTSLSYTLFCIVFIFKFLFRIDYLHRFSLKENKDIFADVANICNIQEKGAEHIPVVLSNCVSNA